MGTRGCVAVGTLEEWRGIYNHWDSYPTGLGEEVWATLKRRRSSKALKALAEEILTFDDWRAFLSGGVCEYCGKKAGQPHTIQMGHPRYAKGKYPDPEARYHKHNEGEAQEHHITSDAADPLFIEWVYVLDPERGLLHVLAHEADPNYKTPNGIAPRSGPPLKRDDGFLDYGHCAYRHKHVTTVEVGGPKPDWEAIERSAHPEYEEEDAS